MPEKKREQLEHFRKSPIILRGEQSHMLDTKGSRGEMSNSKVDTQYYTSSA